MKIDKVKVFGALVVSAFLIMLPTVSLLGENNRSITVVQAYFEAISKQEFRFASELCAVGANEKTRDFSDEINHQFALETVLLEHFGVRSGQDYSIKAKCDNLWIPFAGTDKINLSLRVQGHDESGSMLKRYLNLEGGEYLPGFISLVRAPGGWKIKTINIRESVLGQSYEKALVSMKSSAMFSQKEKSIVINEQVLRPELLNTIEKRVVSFQLNKIISLINDDQKK